MIIFTTTSFRGQPVCLEVPDETLKSDQEKLIYQFDSWITKQQQQFLDDIPARAEYRLKKLKEGGDAL